MSAVIDMYGIRATCARRGLVVLELLDSLVGNNPVLIANKVRCRSAESIVESLTEALAAKSVAVAGLES